jgi:signal transduction histidine kinase
MPKALNVKRLGLRRQDVFLFCFALGALLAIGAAVLQEHHEISLSRERVSAAVIALQSAENISILLLKAETAQRGFLLTGSQTYLQPYFDVRREMPVALKDFDRAIHAIHLDPTKSPSVPELVEAKLDEMSETINLYRTQSPRRATDVVRTNLGKHLMDQFAIRDNQVKLGCVQVLTAESDRLRERNKSVLYITTIGFPTVLVTLVLTGLRLGNLFRRQIELIAQNQSATEQYRLLAAHLESVREEERSHLAREIHDVLGQAITVAKLQITMVRRRLARGSADLDTVLTNLDDTSMSLDGMIKTMRQVANELHPPLLDSMGLHAALLAYTKELEAKTHLRIHFESPDELPELTSKQNITAYRICQESLTNVARHARADYASVSLLCLGEAITLKIQDNGIGLTDPSIESRTSFGLLGMQERAELIDGELAIRSDGGTTVILQFPVNGPKSERPEWRKPT